jgi:hypothetical protein
VNQDFQDPDFQVTDTLFHPDTEDHNADLQVLLALLDLRANVVILVRGYRFCWKLVQSKTPLCASPRSSRTFRRTRLTWNERFVYHI